MHHSRLLLWVFCIFLLILSSLLPLSELCFSFSVVFSLPPNSIYLFIYMCLYIFICLFIHQRMCVHISFIYLFNYPSICLYIFSFVFPLVFSFFLKKKKLKTFPFYFPVHVNIKVSFIHVFCFYSKCLYQLRQAPVCVVVCK